MKRRRRTILLGIIGMWLAALAAARGVDASETSHAEPCVEIERWHSWWTDTADVRFTLPAMSSGGGLFRLGARCWWVGIDTHPSRPEGCTLELSSASNDACFSSDSSLTIVYDGQTVSTERAVCLVDDSSGVQLHELDADITFEELRQIAKAKNISVRALFGVLTLDSTHLNALRCLISEFPK